MDRYNTSHCLDMTAALAITKADRDIKNGKTTKKIKKSAGLTYKISEVFGIKCVYGKILIHKRGAGDHEVYKM